MRILHIQNTDWLKRNPAQQHHLAEMLSLRGHEIRVIDFDILWRHGPKGLRSRRQVFENVSKIHKGARVTVIRPPIIKVPIVDYVSLFISQRGEIDRQIREFRPDIIISPGLVSYLAGHAARRHGLPFVFYWIDVIHRLIPFKFLQPIGWWLERRTLKMADRVLTINEELRDYVIRLGADPGRTQVIRAGIDLEKFDLSLTGQAVRSQYGLADHDFVLFFMGWLYDFSGLKEVAETLLQGRNGAGPRLLIVGEGDAYEELKRISRRADAGGRIIMTGKKPYSEIPGHIAAADICLLPAYNNDIMRNIVPIKLYEYLAMGKPVIATRLPGVMREFADGNGVVYVDRPEDVVSKAIELKNAGAIAELGRKARRFVERNSWDKIADAFEAVLRESISDKHKSPNT